ncbi:MAG: type IV pilus assembly protein PilM [Phycisphaerae bacterium]|nr:type IV pilus assembly protein PilM [Phycisphaerae bacterium]
MPSSSVSWGLEIGAGAIKALRLELSGNEPRVTDFVIVPHIKVLSTPGLDQNDALRVALGSLMSQVDLAGASIAVSVPGHAAFARFAKLPPVEPKKVPDIVKFEAVQQIPFPIDQVEWDYQTFANADSPDVEVGIFAITRDRIMERLQLYEDVGIVPDQVTLSPVAAYNALAHDLAFTESTPGTIILDIGTTSTDLIIAEAGRVWIRTFPIGGHHFTEALVNAFSITYPKAEKLKREAENTKHARQIFQAMRPVFGDLAQDVQRSIGFYQSLHKEAKLERLIGIGSTFRLPGLRKYLKQQLSLDVFRMEQFKRISLDGPKAGEFQANTLNLVTAYGLALQGLGFATLDANLMPTSVIRGAMWRRKVKWFGLAAGVAVAASGAMFIRPFIDSTAVADNPVPPAVRQLVSDVQREKAAAADVTGGVTTNAAAAEALSLLESRDIIAHVVADLGSMMDAANAKAAKVPGPDFHPAFVVKSMATRIHVPGDDGSPDGAPTVPGLDPALASQPRITITLEVSTTQGDPLPFAITTLEAWLKANKKRPNVPYEIIEPSRNSIVLTGSEVAKGPESPEGAQPGGRGDAGGFVPPRTGVNIPGARPGAIVMGGQGEGPRGGGSPYQPPQPGERLDQNAAAALDNIKKLAPLPGALPPPPGTVTSSLSVTWTVVILPKAASAGGAS